MERYETRGLEKTILRNGTVVFLTVFDDLVRRVVLQDLEPGSSLKNAKYIKTEYTGRTIKDAINNASNLCMHGAKQDLHIKRGAMPNLNNALENLMFHGCIIVIGRQRGKDDIPNLFLDIQQVDPDTKKPAKIFTCNASFAEGINKLFELTEADLNKTLQSQKL